MKRVWSFSNSQWEGGRGKRIHLKLSKHQPRNSLGTPNARQTTSVRRRAVSRAPLPLISLAQALVTLSQRSSIYQSLFFLIWIHHMEAEGNGNTIGSLLLGFVIRVQNLLNSCSSVVLEERTSAPAKRYLIEWDESRGWEEKWKMETFKTQLWTEKKKSQSL